MNTTFQDVNLAGLPGWLAPAERKQSATPVLFLHGAMCHHKHLVSLMGFFAAAGYDSYAISRRGRLGSEPANASGLSFQDYVDDTLRMIDALGVPPIVIGHSLGGLIAQKVAELGKCKAAILLAPAPPGMLVMPPVAVSSLVPHLPAILAGQPFLASKETLGRLVFHKCAAHEVDALAGTMVHESGVVFRELMAGAIRIERSRVTCPVLAVAGGEDRVITPEAVRLAAQQTGAEFVEFPNQAHWLIGEPGWETVARKAVDWLASRGLHQK